MKDGTKYKQGDIVLIPFPYSDLTSSKQRPAIIVSNKKMDKFEDIICCLITSNPTKEGISIKGGDFKKGRLPFKSWIKPYRVFTIHNKIIKRKLCSTKNVYLGKIVEELRSYILINAEK